MWKRHWKIQEEELSAYDNLTDGRNKPIPQELPKEEQIPKKVQCPAITQRKQQCKNMISEGRFCNKHKGDVRVPEQDESKRFAFQLSDYDIISPAYNFQNEAHVETYCAEKVKPIDDVSTLLIKSYAGSGKTEVVSNLFKKKPAGRYAYVAPIRALANAVASRLPGFVNYLEKDVDIWSHNKVIISFFSLYKMGYQKPFDIIVIDESEELCGMIYSEIMMQNNHKEIARGFFWHVKNAKQVICLDAAMSRRTYSLIKYIRKEVYVSINLFPQVKREVRLVKHKKQIDIIAGIIQIIKSHPYEQENLKFAFTSANSSIAHHLYDTALQLGIKAVIHTKRQPNQQILLDVNKYWQEYTLIIITAKVSVGVDCQIPMFKTFAYFSANIALRTQFQMTMRFRNVMKELVVFQNPHAFAKGVTKADINDVMSTLRLPGNLSRTILETAICETRKKVGLDRLDRGFQLKKLGELTEQLDDENNNECFVEQATYNKLESVAVANHYRQILHVYARLYNYVGFEKPEDSAFKADDTIKTMNEKEFDQLSLIDSSVEKDYVALKCDGMITLDQELELQKKNFVDRFDYTSKTEEKKKELARLYNGMYIDLSPSSKIYMYLTEERSKNPRKNKDFDEKIQHIKQTFYALGVDNPTKPGTRIALTKFKKFDEDWQKKTSLLFDICPKQINNGGLISHNTRIIKKMIKGIGMTLANLDKHNTVLNSRCGLTMGLDQLLGKEIPFCM